MFCSQLNPKPSIAISSHNFIPISKGTTLVSSTTTPDQSPEEKTKENAISKDQKDPRGQASTPYPASRAGPATPRKLQGRHLAFVVETRLVLPRVLLHLANRFLVKLLAVLDLAQLKVVDLEAELVVTQLPRLSWIIPQTYVSIEY